MLALNFTILQLNWKYFSVDIAEKEVIVFDFMLFCSICVFGSLLLYNSCND